MGLPPIGEVGMLRKAKMQLADNWLNVAIATLIIYVIIGAASFTYVGELLLTGPMYFGFALYIMCVADTRRSDLNLLFKGFERFVDTMVAGLLYTLLVGIGTALLIVPGIIAMCGLSMTFFIMAEDKTISGVDALQLSWNMMRGHKWDYFCLMMRFFGWFLLACLTCGIGFLWLYPYVIATTYNYYRQLRYGSY